MLEANGINMHVPEPICHNSVILLLQNICFLNDAVNICPGPCSLHMNIPVRLHLWLTGRSRMLYPFDVLQTVSGKCFARD